MESTGIYWKPVWNALEKHFPLILANPYQVKSIPSEKTDPRDTEWIADLLGHGLIRPSFVPPVEIRQFRDLTRHRVKLVQDRNRVHNRIHRVLEDASLKLDTVASDILGATGRKIIEAIIAGEDRPDWLADKAQGTLRSKRNQLRLALRGQLTEHHRCMLRRLLEGAEVPGERNPMPGTTTGRGLAVASARYRPAVSIPGVNVITAWTLIAELGPDMNVFADSQYAASRAGLCPGNRESGGKQLSQRTRRGNRWLRRALCQSARTITHKKDCYLTASQGRYWHSPSHRGHRHKILVIAYHVLRDGISYQEWWILRPTPSRASQESSPLASRATRLGCLHTAHAPFS